MTSDDALLALNAAHPAGDDCWVLSTLHQYLHWLRICRSFRNCFRFRFRNLPRFHLRLRITWRCRITLRIT